ncbi:hypothetical protein QYF36_016463 [Acer negundo]|nr:hypothetical protein QYF36_016463 [Acer negundo]
MEAVIVEEESSNRMMLFPKLDYLMLTDLPKLTKFYHFTENLSADTPASNEENLHTDIQPLFDEKVGLPALKLLKIRNMESLEKIWNDDQLNSNSFYKLEDFQVCDCNKLLNVFQSNMLGRFERLDFLSVRNCSSLEEIFELEALKDTKTNAIINIATQLRHLELVSLPKLKHVWNIDSSSSLLGFRNLVKILIRNCDSMRSLFPASISKDLRQLEKLEITYCCMVEEIVAKGEEVEEPTFVFPQLKKLTLGFLSRLKSFYPGLYVSKWPMLKHLTLCNCEKVDIISSSSLTSFQENDAEGQREISIRQPLFLVDQVAFPSLEVMALDWNIMVKDILHGNFSEYSCKLKELELVCLRKEDAILSNCFLYTLPNLEKLEASGCFKEIFLCKEFACKGKHAEPDVAALSKLRNLKLLMPQLLHLWKENSQPSKLLENLATLEVGFCGLQHLTLSEFPHLKEVWRDHHQLPVSFFCNLKSMVVDECDENMISSSAISDNMLLCLDYLEKLEVRNCDSQQVFDLEELNADGHFEVLSQLSQFYLTDLPRLNHIWKKIHPTVFSFRNLKRMNIHKCNSLRYVFTPSVAFGLGQLQKLEIKQCAIMEEIITMEVDQEDAAAIDNKITFPQLNFTVLESLPNFTSFYQGSNNNTMFLELNKVRLKDLPKLTTFCNFNTGDLIELLSLSELWIENCPNMKTFISNSTSRDMPAGSEKSEEMNSEENLLMQPLFGDKVVLSGLKELGILQMDNLRKIGHDQLSLDVCKLEELRIQSCNKLLNVFQSNMFRRLQRLEILVVLHCDSLEEIFECQALSGGKTVHVTAALQLKQLHLSCLPKLMHLWNMDCQGLLGFQNLISIVVHQCNSLKNIFPASIAAGLLQLEKLHISSCMVEEIVANDEEEEEVDVVTRFVFPQLTSLQLLQLSKLKSFCSGLYISEWPVLKELMVWLCHKVEAIASEFSSFQETQHGESQHDDISIIRQPLFLVDKVAFPSLEELSMEWNRFVKEIFHGKFSSEYSCKLKVLMSFDFPNRSCICLSCFLCKFPNLERLEVYHGLLKEMFRGDHQGLCSSKEKHADEVPFKLCHLKLFNLSDSYLWEENSHFSKVFHDMAILEVLKCDVLENLVPSSTTFRNLTTLEVLNCGRLLSLVTYSTAQSLVQLKRMNISDCKTMKEIITVVGDEVKENRIIFNRLEYLGLHCLPSLISFLLGNCDIDIEFPSLQQVNVTLCPKMKTFSQGALSTPKLYTVQTKEMKDEGRWEGDLNGTIEQLFIEMSGEMIVTSGCEETIVVAEIDYSAIELQRYNLPLERQRRRDVYEFIDISEAEPKETQLGVSPSRFTFSSVLAACARIPAFVEGKQVHAKVVQLGFLQNKFVLTALLDMYAKCGFVMEARRVFDVMDDNDKDVTACTAMICGYTKMGMMDDAQRLFDVMKEQNVISWSAMVAGYANCGDMRAAKELYDWMIEKNSVTWVAMVAGYGKCGDVSEAKSVFDGILEPDASCWAAMVVCYAQNGYAKESIEMYKAMREGNVRISEVAMVGAISACTQLGDIEMAAILDKHVEDGCCDRTQFVSNALIHMHAKCGCLEQARREFDRMKDRDIVSYSAMITALANHGKSEEALHTFLKMKEEGIKPNQVTFIGVLNACSQGGLVEEGLEHFQLMTRNLGIKPLLEHLTCMVDLLGKAGQLEKAYGVIMEYTNAVDGGVWGALLGACKVHEYNEIPFQRFRFLLKPKYGSFCLYKRMNDSERVPESLKYTLP